MLRSSNGSGYEFFKLADRGSNPRRSTKLDSHPPNPGSGWDTLENNMTTTSFLYALAVNTLSVFLGGLAIIVIVYIVLKLKEVE